MMKSYHRLCTGDRKVIYKMNKAGLGQAEIDRSNGFDQSTVSKELPPQMESKVYRLPSRWGTHHHAPYLRGTPKELAIRMKAEVLIFRRY